VPAAAVIPAPRAYINVVAVKKPVVGFESTATRGEALGQVSGSGGVIFPRTWRTLRHAGSSTGGGSIKLDLKRLRSLFTPQGAPAAVTVSKPECSRQPSCHG